MLGLYRIDKSPDVFLRSFNLYIHAFGRIGDISGKAVLKGKLINEGTEADPLHNPLNRAFCPPDHYYIRADRLVFTSSLTQLYQASRPSPVLHEISKMVIPGFIFKASSFIFSTEQST